MGIEDDINRIGSEEQEDAQVFERVGAVDKEVPDIHASILPRGSDIRSPTSKNNPAPARDLVPQTPPSARTLYPWPFAWPM